MSDRFRDDVRDALGWCGDYSDQELVQGVASAVGEREDFLAKLTSDRWYSEAMRWRARVSVTGQDVADARITRQVVEDWLTAQGWAPSQGEGSWRVRSGPGISKTLTTWRSTPRDGRGVSVPDEDGAHDDIADAIRSSAHHFRRPAWEIFDELAARVD